MTSRKGNEGFYRRERERSQKAEQWYSQDHQREREKDSLAPPPPDMSQTGNTHIENESSVILFGEDGIPRIGAYT